MSHAEPQLPQLDASDWMSTHVPPQSVAFDGQTHLPLVHVADWLHWTEQLPQLFGSLRKSTHTPLQNVSVADVQVSWQTPATHEAPVGHWWLQTPQLFGSFCTSPHAGSELLFVPLPDDPQPGAAMRNTEAGSVIVARTHRTRL